MRSGCRRCRLVALLLVVWLMGLTGSRAVGAQEEVNVYSYRNPQLLEPLFAAFTEQSGIKINSVFISKGMLERLQSEAENSPADLIFTADIGRLTDMKAAGLTQPVDSEAISNNIPAQFRDPQGHWFGLTSRARIIVTAKDRVPFGAVTRYEDLADPKWRGAICTRSGKHPYMTALIASMIAHQGHEESRKWLMGLKRNLARKPQGNDRAQVKAISQGECDIAIINHYYMALMLSDPEQLAWANSVNVIFPNQSDRGAHMNVSGMALTKHAPHRDAAVRLMAFLASDEGQKRYVDDNGEYPVTPGIPWNDLQRSWGPFKQDTISLTAVADQRAAAIRLADEVRYDH